MAELVFYVGAEEILDMASITSKISRRENISIEETVQLRSISTNLVQRMIHQIQDMDAKVLQEVQDILTAKKRATLLELESVETDILKMLHSNTEEGHVPTKSRALERYMVFIQTGTTLKITPIFVTNDMTLQELAEEIAVLESIPLHQMRLVHDPAGKPAGKLDLHKPSTLRDSHIKSGDRIVVISTAHPSTVAKQLRSTRSTPILPPPQLVHPAYRAPRHAKSTRDLSKISERYEAGAPPSTDLFDAAKKTTRKSYEKALRERGSPVARAEKRRSRIPQPVSRPAKTLHGKGLKVETKKASSKNDPVPSREQKTLKKSTSMQDMAAKIPKKLKSFGNLKGKGKSEREVARKISKAAEGITPELKSVMEWN